MKGGSEDVGKAQPPSASQKGHPSKPASPATKKGVAASLSASDRISYERELKRVESGIKTIDGSYSDHQDWDAEDLARHRELKARRKELMAALGWKA